MKAGNIIYAMEDKDLKKFHQAVRELELKKACGELQHVARLEDCETMKFEIRIQAGHSRIQWFH